MTEIEIESQVKNTTVVTPENRIITTCAAEPVEPMYADVQLGLKPMKIVGSATVQIWCVA